MRSLYGSYYCTIKFEQIVPNIRMMFMFLSKNAPTSRSSVIHHVYTVSEVESPLPTKCDKNWQEMKSQATNTDQLKSCFELWIVKGSNEL